MSRVILLLVLLLLLKPGRIFGLDEAPLLAEGDRLYDTRDEPGHAEEAIADYKKMVEADPKNEEALWRLSRSLKWKGDIAGDHDEKLAAYKEAERWAEKAVEADPGAVGGHLMLGIAYGRIGETQGVMKSLSLISPIKKEMNLVLAKDPRNDVAHHVLGVLYRKVPGLFGGSIKKSIEELKMAIDANPSSAIHHLELAKSYLEKDQNEEARRELQTLLAITTPSDRVQAKRDRAEAEKLLSELSK